MISQVNLLLATHVHVHTYMYIHTCTCVQVQVTHYTETLSRCMHVIIRIYLLIVILLLNYQKTINTELKNRKTITVKKSLFIKIDNYYEIKINACACTCCDTINTYMYMITHVCNLHVVHV